MKEINTPAKYPANATAQKAVRILIADDEEAVVHPLRRALATAGFYVAYMPDGAAALDALRVADAKNEPFDVLLSDVQMPRLRGDKLQRLARAEYSDLIIFLITSYEDIDLAVSCMREGVADYVTKPYQIEDVKLRLYSALEKRRLAQQVRDYQSLLEVRVAERTQEIQDQFLRAIKSLQSALEAKDNYTSEHSLRVCRQAVQLAKYIRPDDPVLYAQIETAAQLHDIGKIGVPSAIINKPGRLDVKEQEVIRQHPLIGNEILLPLVRDAAVLDIVRHHHEWWNGSGYPGGLSGHDIPLGARILAVADAFDAMTSHRPYREAIPIADALALLKKGAETQWDAQIVAVFVGMTEENAFSPDVAFADTEAK